MSLSDFIKRAVAHGVEGVSIESFMLPDATPDGREDLRQLLDENGLERVWAWGHPRGLHSGTVPEELQNLCHHVDVAAHDRRPNYALLCGGRSTQTRPWDEHRRLLLPLLEKAADYAARSRSSWRSKTHIDLLADELEELVTTR